MLAGNRELQNEALQITHLHELFDNFIFRCEGFYLLCHPKLLITDFLEL